MLPVSRVWSHHTRYHTRSTSKHYHWDRYRYITEAIIGVLHNPITPALIIIAVTHHTKDHPHAEVIQLIPETTANPDHVLHINQVRQCCLNLHPALAGQQLNHRIGNITESQ